MDWVGLRVGVRERIKGDGLQSMVKTALMYMICFCILYISIFVVNLVCNMPVAILGALMDSSKIIAVLTVIFSLVSIAANFICISFYMQGMILMIKNYLLTGEINIQLMFSGFKSDVREMILRTNVYWLGQIAWRYALCIIPSIPYIYRTLLVPFILTENPDMTPKEICALSTEIMMGHRMEFFIQVQIYTYPFLILGGLLACCTLSLSYFLATVYVFGVTTAYYMERIKDYMGEEEES